MIIIFKLSRGGHLIMDRIPKGYEVAEHIAKKIAVNPQMLSTLKKSKSIQSMYSEEIPRYQWLDL